LSTRESGETQAALLLLSDDDPFELEDDPFDESDDFDPEDEDSDDDDEEADSLLAGSVLVPEERLSLR
jgi:hypothetical protein